MGWGQGYAFTRIAAHHGLTLANRAAFGVWVNGLTMVETAARFLSLETEKML